MTDAQHPDAVLEHMLKHGGYNEARQAQLCAIHSLARTRFDSGERNFLPDVMGKALVAAGVMGYTTYAGSSYPEYRELGRAWQDFADHVDLTLNHNAPPGHPDAVILKLLAVPKRRGTAAATIRAIYKACRDRFNRNELNFSPAAVGQETEAAGTVSEDSLRAGLKTRGYGELIEAWQRLADEREAHSVKSTPAVDAEVDDDGDAPGRPRAPRYRQTAADEPNDGPDAVLASLLRERGLKRSTADVLRNMHRICRARFERGELDFSRSGCAREFVAAMVFGSNKHLVHRLAATPRYADLLDAWQSKADATWMEFSPDLPPSHPHLVFRRLREKFLRSDKQETLFHVHRVCHLEHAAGRLNFEVQTIGRLLEERGVLAAKSLQHPVYDDIRILLKAWDEYARPWAFGEGAPPASERVHSRRSHNPDFEWVRRDHPEFENWRVLASEWVQLSGGSMGARIATLNAFFEAYLTRDDVSKHPVDLLRRGQQIPDIMATVCKEGATNRTNRNNQLFEFFQWVLLRDFSVEDDRGEAFVPAEFRNPLSRARGEGGGGSNDESVRNSLPYGYVYRLRRLLAQGPTFKDWTFAQGASGVSDGGRGRPSTHWYEVDRELIDVDDPDCVWRIRETKNGRVFYEMWSPVRWVALLVKLLLPVRGGQVRLLDSGESDYWKLVEGEWTKNDHPLAAGSEGRPWQQGVLRREGKGPVVSTVLFMNTNKTADRNKEGPSKGYVMPWISPADQLENVFYWLEKLRNWQSKYNPVVRRTNWRDLRAKHLNVKTDGALKAFPDACFLFRTPEAKPAERGMPTTDSAVSYAWFHLLEALQEELAEAGEVYPDGNPIIFVGRDEKGRLAFNRFPVHSLRVSLITALALDGGVPLELLRKLVGHARLVMTLYYYKPGVKTTVDVLADAATRLDANKEQSIHRFLRDTPHDRLEREVIANSASSLSSAIPIHPADRNPAGWMLMHHGMCLVGGNTSALEGNAKVGGCYNGGPALGPKGSFAPVPGGARNCVRCRWFVTEPHYLIALTDHFNNLAYHLDEAFIRSTDAERKWQELLRRKAELEFAGDLFTEHKQLGDAERLMEATAQATNERIFDIVATLRLIERCQSVLNAGTSEGGTQLLIQGEPTQVMAAFDNVNSELLQLSGVCDGLELYPELEAGKGVLRRSQLLDSALVNEGLPPMFMRLTEDEQLKVGNAFMQRLARVARPDKPFIGKREVVKIIDAGKKLGESLGLDLGDLLTGHQLASVKPTVLKLEAVEA